MYPWLKMLLHCKNKITDIFPYFFKENTVKYFNTFQKNRDEKIETVENSFFHTHCILLPWWNAEKQLKFSSWGSKARAHVVSENQLGVSGAARVFSTRCRVQSQLISYMCCCCNFCSAAAQLQFPQRRQARTKMKHSDLKKQDKKLHGRVGDRSKFFGRWFLLHHWTLRTTDWLANEPWLQVFFRF